MEYRMLFPFFLERVYGKTLEEFLFAMELILEGRHKQTLAKAARTTKEIDRSIRHKVIKQCRLVYINKTILSNLLEVLYSYRVLHNCTFCLQISDISAKIHHPFDLTK